MTPEQMRKVTGFATALGALKAKEELGQGATLTPEEVTGLLWGIRSLRSEVKDDPADNPA
jgi:hypothetical protein